MEPTLSRRQFLRSSAGVTFCLSLAGLAGCDDSAPPAGDVRVKAAQPGPFAWVTINGDDSVVIRTPASEMGQGSMTALPVILAEELDADWDKVRIEFSPADDAIFGNPNLGGLVLTVASWSVASYFDRLRVHGAQMRRILLDNAARRFHVPVAELATEPSVVLHKPSGRRLSFGAIATAARIPVDTPKITADDLKPRSAFRLIGRDLPRRDVPAKVDGSARYSIDVQLPGMVYVAMTRADVHGATVVSVSDHGAKKQPGVIRICRFSDRVGVVATSYPAALAGLHAVQTSWNRQASTWRYDSGRAMATSREQVRNLQVAGFPWDEAGDIDRGFSDAAQRYSAEYQTDYVYHAQIEPLNAVAAIQPDGGIEIWAGTQAPSHTVRAVAVALAIDTTRVVLHRLYLGGGFGRRAAIDQDYVVDAALISKDLNRPVKVIWSREQDLRYARLKPMTAQFLRAGTDTAGNIIAWQHRIASEEPLAMSDGPRYEHAGRAPIIAMLGSEQTTYQIRNRKVEHLLNDTGIRVSPLRGVGVTPNKFAIESFLDEIAAQQNRDPLQLRLQLLQGNRRAQHVLQRAAEMARWRKSRNGRALGLSFVDYDGTLAACIAEISVGTDNIIHAHELWAAVDVGIAVQPGNVRAQVEGGMIFGLSNSLLEHIDIEAGRIRQSNYHDYPVMTPAQAPGITIDVISGGDKPTGVGEVGAIIPAAAVANAFARLTGKRLRRMPFTAERVGALLATA